MPHEDTPAQQRQDSTSFKFVVSIDSDGAPLPARPGLRAGTPSSSPALPAGALNLLLFIARES